MKKSMVLATVLEVGSILGLTAMGIWEAIHIDKLEKINSDLRAQLDESIHATKLATDMLDMTLKTCEDYDKTCEMYEATLKEILKKREESV